MDLIQIEKTEGIATVTIQNPPMNVLSRQVVSELDDAVSILTEDAEVTVVIITGGGDRAFMAGADIKEFPQWVGRDDVRDIALGTDKVFNRIDDMPKPTIALLNGFTLGGGCELALACDIRIAESHAQIGLPEVKLGLFPGAGGTQRLPRLVGEAKAKELMYTGESLSAEEAARIGLVNQVVQKGEGIEAARLLARKIGGHSLQTLSRIKQAVNEGMELELQAAIHNEANLFHELFQTEDVKEGIQAFLEKRTPQFKHR